MLIHSAAGRAQSLEDPATRSAVSAPAMGMLLDPARGVRALLGIPGAAALGEPLELPFPIAAAAAAPGRNYVLLVAGESREARLLRLEPQGGTTTSIAGAAAGAARVVLSPSGSAAALYRDADGLIQIITGLPEAPVLAWQGQAAGAPLRALAVSDDGAALLAGWGGEGAATTLLVSGGASRRLPLEPAAALAFREQSQDAAAITADGTAWFIREATGATECRLVAGPDPRFSDAAGVAFSRDGSRILIASRSGTVARLAVDGAAADFADCRCTPSGLYPLNRAGLFRLNEPSRRPLMLWDAAEESSRFWFVPADAPPAADDTARDGQ